MKIASSDVSLQSSRTFVQKDEKSEELQIWFDRRGAATPTAAATVQTPRSLLADWVTLSSRGRSHKCSNGWGKSQIAAREADAEDAKLAATDPKAYLLKILVEALTGKKMKVRIFDPSAGVSSSSPSELEQNAAAESEQGSNRQGWGLVYDRHESHYEAETTNVAINGVVRAQDGREVNFSLNLSMNREYYTEENFSLRAGDAQMVDPLVINLDGSAAELTDTKFAFDLDADGDTESISFVTQGSGLLVFDKNGDGVVNDGGELFGPTSGNGFAELSRYDDDNNLWIDENDSIFGSLSVWTKDGNGVDCLSSLLASNVGAICLASVDSSFDLRGSGNALNGQVSRTGVYLEEEGVAKSIQQVDLTV